MGGIFFGGGGGGGGGLVYSGSSDPGANEDSLDGFVVGSVGINTSTGEAFVCVDATATAAVWTRVDKDIGKTITVESPTSSENITLFHTDEPLTIKKVESVVSGTTPSVTFNVRHAAARDSGAPNNVFSSNPTADSESSKEHSTGFDDNTIPAGSWIWVITSAIGGTVNTFSITLFY